MKIGVNIVVERNPHVVVTDTLSGWSMTGGRDDAEGNSTKPMTHTDGARCTLRLERIEHNDGGASVYVTGWSYLHADEEGTAADLYKRQRRERPQPQDWEDPFREIARALCVAWHEATYTNVAPMRVLMPGEKPA